MDSREEEFLRTLRATFKVEAQEHLQSIVTGLLELERGPADAQHAAGVVERVFRAAHSLKGAARAVNLPDIERICQSLEDQFAAWKKRGAEQAEFEAAHRLADAVGSALRGRQDPDVTGHLQDGDAGVVELAAVPTVRIAVAKLDAHLLDTESMLSAKLAVSQRAAEMRVLMREFESWRAGWTRLQPEIRAALGGRTSQLSEFAESSQDHLRTLESRFTALAQATEQDRLAVGRLVDDLLNESRKLVMLPFATVSAGLPKIVHDLSRDRGKPADLVIRGEELEIDKRILEEIKDPLIHLVRNSIDHGIEPLVARERTGKPKRARVTVEVAPVDGQVRIEVTDDGAGIDSEAVRRAAVDRGLLSAEQAHALSDNESLELVFQSAITTSKAVTELSGRGLGLAIVREKVEKLGGRVAVASTPGHGTTFTLELPAALATLRGVLIGVADRTFVIPTAEVDRMVRYRSTEVQTLEGRETLSIDGRAVSLASLARLLELPETTAPGEFSMAIVLGNGDGRIAFSIGTVLDEREILLKRLLKPLVRVRFVAGATVLGSGQVAPVLRVGDLLRVARETGATRSSPAPIRVEPASLLTRSILVAEDSITSRMLLKGLLEAAGYRVKTAVDGLDAYTTLRTEKFDLLVSDVEMPRLNGFDLTVRVRMDPKLRDLPVILVTALARPEDREQGVAAGADAYLVKSSFDQTNLLDAVRRLI